MCYTVFMRPLAIHNPFNAPVWYEETVASTMSSARVLAAEGAAHGAVISAGFQEQGRGRIPRRAWDMDRGTSLPFTILLRYGQSGDIPAALPLRVGLAAALAIEDFVPSLGGAVRVKWPNDIMIGSQKAAGILTEADGGLVFIGVGINVAQKAFPGFLRGKAVSISLAVGRDIPPDARFDLLEKTLTRLYEELENPGGHSSGWRGRLEQRLYKKNERVRFVAGEAGSGRVVEGRLAGIGPGGELLITPEGEGEPRAFVTGELAVYGD